MTHMKELKKVLDVVVHKVKYEDNDYFLAIVGEVRKGKSTLALQIAEYCNPDFGLDDIVYTRRQFVKRVQRSDPGDVILVDEGALVFFAKDRGKEMNEIIKLATTMGQYNCIVLTCVPKLTLIEKYIRQDRMKTHIKVFSTRGEKGFYAFFGKRATIKQIRQEEKGMRKGEKRPMYMFRETFGDFQDKKFFEAYKRKKKKETEVKDDEMEPDNDKRIKLSLWAKDNGMSTVTAKKWVHQYGIDHYLDPNGLVFLTESQIKLLNESLFRKIEGKP